jgi:hypothetical protein
MSMVTSMMDVERKEQKKFPNHWFSTFASYKNQNRKRSLASRCGSTVELNLSCGSTVELNLNKSKRGIYVHETQIFRRTCNKKYAILKAFIFQILLYDIEHFRSQVWTTVCFAAVKQPRVRIGN